MDTRLSVRCSGQADPDRRSLREDSDERDAERKGHQEPRTVFIWSVADLLRGDYKQSEYGKVILPLDGAPPPRLCARADQGARCSTRHEQLKGKVENLDPVLDQVAGRAVLQHVAARLRASCSTTRRRSPTTCAPTSPASREAARDVLDKFEFDTQIDRLDQANLLYLVVSQVRRDRPAPRRGLEPRDGLPLRGADPPVLGALQRDRRRALHAPRGHPADGEPPLHRGRATAHRSRGSSGRCSTPRAAPAACSRSPRTTSATLNPDATLEVFGQELNAETYAICRSDMMLKGQDASTSCSATRSPKTATPASGSTTCSPTRRSGSSGRRSPTSQGRARAARASPAASVPACPRINDGSFLFLQHMISKMKPRRGRRLPPRDRLQRLAAVHRRRRLGRVGDPPVDHRERLARSRRRAARPALLQHRHLHVLLDRHQPQEPRAARQGAARRRPRPVREDAQEPRREAQGDQRASRSPRSSRLYGEFVEGDRVKIFANEAFGFQRITVERPLRLRWEINAETLAALEGDRSSSRSSPKTSRTAGARRSPRTTASRRRRPRRRSPRSTPMAGSPQGAREGAARRARCRATPMPIRSPTRKGNPSPTPTCVTTRTCRSPQCR